MRQNPQDILKKYFGYDTFLPRQLPVIETVLAGQDCLVLMPTGGGKSLCYQVPALTLPGLCVVVSPLIALMKDQVEALLANGVSAAYLNSTLTAEAQYQLENKCLAGALKLLYVSPEKLLSPGFFAFLKRLPVNLFAIDEAHCISAWGHDFRPEYTQLRHIKDQFPAVPLIALTATADRLTRQDILQQLGLTGAQVFVSSFDRPNLNLTVLPAKNRIKVITDFLQKHHHQPGIIYCLSRNSTEQLAQKLRADGFKATAYHAGLPAPVRAKAQENFLQDNVQIVCATVAFGMGIDKSNVRWVIHYNLPKNMESYYQEIGRGGRDGAPAAALLFYSYADVMKMRDMLKEGPPEQATLQIAKLERLQHYAEAATCRRKILLQYFGETLTKNCGNCDNCRNPPATFDGTQLAQKALSAVFRMQEKVNLGLLIDVLRGARTQAVLVKGYDKIKTYGAGKELPAADWQGYLHQFINAGLLEIAYEEGYALKLSRKSREVLFNSEKVYLVKYRPATSSPEVTADRRPKKQLIKDELFERLRALRKTLADEKQVPPYVIFSDSTLLEMAEAKPANRLAMLAISGVGMVKFENYGASFINEIMAFITHQQAAGNTLKGATHLVTYEAYQRGLTPEQIAAKRNLNLITVYSHLATLYEQNYRVDIQQYISASEYQLLQSYFNRYGTGQPLKSIFAGLQETIPYFKIRLGLAVYNKINQPVV